MTLMKNSKDSRHAISSLFAFALFALFVILMLLMVVISAQGYRRTVERGEQTAGIRTALGYIKGKVLSGAARNGAEVRVIDGHDVLILSMESEDGEPLETAIYCYDGMLMEQFYGVGGMDYEEDEITLEEDEMDFEEDEMAFEEDEITLDEDEMDFDEDEMGFDLESGQGLIDLEKLSMNISETGRVLYVTVQEAGGTTQSLRIALSEVWGGSE